MSTSESYVEESEFESLSDGVPHSQSSSASEENVYTSLSAPAPYDDEPIANEERVQKYKERKEKENAHVNALQDRLDDKIPITDWCKCNNCGLDMIQNVYETQCCQEIERCVLSLNSDEELEDVEMSPCITNHPGFRLNCLEKWILRLAASNYRRKERQKYIQIGSENAFLRSVYHTDNLLILFMANWVN